MTARIFQHEMEHMDGENFLADIGEFALRRAKEKQRKLLEKVRRQKNKILRAQKQKR
jgi:peptide deformylase